MPRKKKKSPQLIFLPFILVAVLTLTVAFIKYNGSEAKEIYVKVKVSQGYWWAATEKPNIWYARGINKGDKEYNLLNKPIAEILQVRYYPYSLEDDTYDIYLDVKLAGDYNQRKGQYIFKRSAIVVGAPIELETSGTLISGTVIEFSNQEFDNNYVDKIVTFMSEGSYTTDNPYLYNSIQVGDQYFDGEEVVFEVLEKQLRRTVLLSTDQYGNVFGRQIPSVQNILVIAKLKANQKDDYLYFGEEKLLTVGSSILISIDNFNIDNKFIIGEVADPK